MLLKLTFLFSLFSCSLFSQSQESLSIFIDCSEWICDQVYFKQELENVSFVRDQSDADVHIFFITQRNATRGRSFEIEFIGQGNYAKFKDVLKFDINGDMTELESSDKILKYLRLGLMRFWIENGIAEQLTLDIEKNDDSDNVENDPWNKWSFTIRANGWFYGQESSSSANINGNVTVERITDVNKFRLRVGISKNRSVFTYDGEEIISDKKRNYLSIKDIFTLNNHWSTGIFSSTGSSVFGNYTFHTTIEPGIEYNFFPYNISSKKQLVLFYQVGARYNNYIEKTIFDKDSELLWQQTLGMGGLIKKKWGRIEGSVIFENYLHQFSLNNFDFFLSTDIRLFKGMSLNFNGGYSIVHNQVNIAAVGTTKEELLLQQKELQSGFDYWFNGGIRYSFGSIFNTVVNSRFDY